MRGLNSVVSLLGGFCAIECCRQIGGFVLAVAVTGDCFDLGLELRCLLSVIFAVAMMVGGWCNGCCTQQERCGVTSLTAVCEQQGRRGVTGFELLL